MVQSVGIRVFSLFRGYKVFLPMVHSQISDSDLGDDDTGFTQLAMMSLPPPCNPQSLFEPTTRHPLAPQYPLLQVTL